MELQDKVVVITGAAGGLGKTFAQDFAAQGAHLALVDLNAEKLSEVRDLCTAQGVKSEIYTADVSQETAVEELFEQIVQDFGTLDGVINNAGIIRDSLLVKKKEDKITKMSISQWQHVLDVNLTGVFLCGRETAAQLLKLGRPGVIVNISSISRAGNMGQTNYSASKAGVMAMTVTWAKELSRYGIRVGAVAPGYAKTEMIMAIRPEVQEKLLSTIPLRRFAEPSEISHSVRYIFENDFFTGRVIEADGGMRL